MDRMVRCWVEPLEEFPMSEQKPYRLPTTVTPEVYQIRLTPDLSAARFAGEEKVLLQIQEPVREIILNAAELELKSVSIKGSSSTTIQGEAVLDTENEQATLKFAQELNPGRWEWRSTFSGILSGNLH